MPSGVGKAAGRGSWVIFLIVAALLAAQIGKFSHGLVDRSAFAFADSLFVLIFSFFLMWSFAHGYRWARWAGVCFALAMFGTSEGGFLAFGSGASWFETLTDFLYLFVIILLLVPPMSMMTALETARTSRYGPDYVLPNAVARRHGLHILIAMIVFAALAQLTWMVPDWWRSGTLPGVTEAVIFGLIALTAHGLWRCSENARAWTMGLSFAACFWFLALGVFAPEPNDFFIALGLTHLAIPSGLVSWRSVQAYFRDKDLEAKWEYVQPTPRRPKAWGETDDGSSVFTAGDSSKHGA